MSTVNPLRWIVYLSTGLMAITVSLGEAVAVCALLVTILIAVLGSYVAVIRRLDAQDAARATLAVALNNHREHVDSALKDQAEETRAIRRRLHQIANTVNTTLMQAFRREKEDHDGRKR